MADKSYHFHEPTVLKSGSVILLETSGPLQTCTGIALSLALSIHDVSIIINHPVATFGHQIQFRCTIELHPDA